MKPWLPIPHPMAGGQRNMAAKARFPSDLLVRLVVAPTTTFLVTVSCLYPARSDLTVAAGLSMIRNLYYPSARL